MPLSEHEQQMLAQLEQALASEDPRFADQMRGGAVRGQRRTRLVVGLVGLVVGLGLVLLGVNTTMWVGVAGFAIMVAAVAYALSPGRTLDAQPPSPGGVERKGPKGPASSGFMSKLDERWEKRERDL
ncbi:MAG TPA: DUF3040 domain-containing protein [Phycicoccus sp.]|nr:DUF3040 domain-containing protein [Phycicoccus sp.]HRA44079.1 DUF3040 domain-containing protein [Phycicoccus sp.]